MVTPGIVMINMLSIYVATAGIVMSNILSNCVEVYTCIDKPVQSVLQAEVHSIAFYLYYVGKIGLTLHAQVVCSVFSASLGCY